MKTLYDFTVPRKSIVEEKEETDEGTLTRKVEKVVDVKLCLKKPNRKEKEQGDMVYAQRLSECIRAGLLTKAQISKEYSELGGVWSENEEEEYKKLENLYQEYSEQYTQAQIRFANDNTKENKETLGKI